ncbi:MAG: thiamine pyrophosphate-requiring protein [Rhizobiaceae bacterium]
MESEENSSAGTVTSGGAIFARLKKLGVDYVFCNSGTDFPPIIEGLAEAAAKDIDLPKAIVIPHEHAAVSMAHGYYQASRRAQAVMLHTNVGLSNGATGMINAAHDNIPMLLMSGRTPITEQGHFGARTVPIGWGQEMRDQTALVREATKWDYELRFGDQIVELLDRANAITNSTPKGPVYISLPRETLCEAIDADELDAEPCMEPALASARQQDIERLAGLIAEAKTPVIFSQRGTGSQSGFKALTKLVEDWAIPVNMYWAQSPAIPTGHAMNAGNTPLPWLEDADLVIVIDALAPWMPDIHKPAVDAKIVNIGPNPLFSRTPIRNFHSHLSIAGEPDETVATLVETLGPLRAGHADRIEERRNAVSARTHAIREAVFAKCETGNKSPMSKLWVAKCVSDAIERSGKKAAVTSELGCPLAPMSINHFSGYIQEPHSGGLGWGLPAALGYQLAEPETLVFATMGDGSYIFSNPTACHQIAEALELPVITCILNNEEWGAVRHSVVGLYPHGHASKANTMPLTALKPSPNFVKTAEASRAYVETVENGADLPDALDRAVRVATQEKRQVLLNIKIDGEPA